MASRLYPTTRQLFRRIAQSLSMIGLAPVVGPIAFALISLCVTGLILLDRRQTPWRMQEWLPARYHDALNFRNKAGTWNIPAKQPKRARSALFCHFGACMS